MNQNYGRLRVVREIEPPTEISYAKAIGAWYLCQCSCGNTTKVPKASLIRGNTTSCGCLRKERAAEQIKQNQARMRENGTSTKPITKERILEHNNVRMNLSDWAKHIGISKQALQQRLDNDWPLEKALSGKGESL